MFAGKQPNLLLFYSNCFMCCMFVLQYAYYIVFQDLNMSHSQFHQAESFEQFPQSIAEASGELVINDLRANTLKLLFRCIEAGIISGISKKDYKTLVTIYNKTPELLTSANLDKFDEIINKLRVEPHQTIRILGDDVCHEGNNDYFTLSVLQKLNQAGVLIEIMLSPRSAEFLS